MGGVPLGAEHTLEGVCRRSMLLFHVPTAHRTIGKCHRAIRVATWEGTGASAQVESGSVCMVKMSRPSSLLSVNVGIPRTLLSKASAAILASVAPEGGLRLASTIP